MKNRLLIGLLIIILFLLIAIFSLLLNPPDPKSVSSQNMPRSIISPTPSLTLEQPPVNKLLPNTNHIFQTFNNCGPAALSMALSYYGIYKTQQTLGEILRPYQIPRGDNDDKSVALEELAKKAKEYSLIPYHRPNGSIELIKLFITYDIPIIARTLLKENEDIGHYRIVKGYDDTTGEINQDDSLQGKNLRYSYEEFNLLWKQFNYEYLVLVPNDKQQIAEAILGTDANAKVSWERAAQRAQKDIESNPDDIYFRFNLSVAYYNIGNYQQSVAEFEKTENKLPFRTLWYQIEPIKAYFALGNDEKVFSLTNTILTRQNRAFSELYILRGKIYQKQGNTDQARKEFEKAVFYNKNLKEAQVALKSLES